MPRWVLTSSKDHLPETQRNNAGRDDFLLNFSHPFLINRIPSKPGKGTFRANQRISNRIYDFSVDFPTKRERSVETWPWKWQLNVWMLLVHIKCPEISLFAALCSGLQIACSSHYKFMFTCFVGDFSFLPSRRLRSWLKTKDVLQFCDRFAQEFHSDMELLSRSLLGNIYDNLINEN